MTTRPLAPLLLALLVALPAACKGDSETKAEPEAKPDLGPKAKAASDEVPEAMKAKLSFEPQELDDGNILAVVPKGWKPGFIPGRFEPADGEFGVSYSVGSNCDGACVSKDWLPIIDKVEFTNSVPEGMPVELDEALGETGKLKVFARGNEVHVRAVWWKADGNRYFHCRADLEGESTAAKQAFVSACKATHVVDWD